MTGSGLNVLLVEDDLDIRGLMRFCLEDDSRCAAVTEVGTAEQAVHTASTGPFEVILLDFMLRNGTAADCLPRLRRLQPAAWIVVYTANRAAAESADVVGLGADLLVEKVSMTVDDIVAAALGRGGS